MDRESLFRGKHIHTLSQNEHLDGAWIEGYLCDENHINSPELMGDFLIDPETVCRYTGKTDKTDRKIFEGDICKLILPDGEIRYFKVSIKSVVRKVLCHPDFEDEVSKVEITGIVFEWNGYELFPCIDTYGVPDYKMMEVVGNIFDNPELVTSKCSECKCRNCFSKSECCSKCEGPILNCEEYSETDIYNPNLLEGGEE